MIKLNASEGMKKKKMEKGRNFRGLNEEKGSQGRAKAKRIEVNDVKKCKWGKKKLTRRESTGGITCRGRDNFL